MNNEEENVLEDWNEILEIENARRKKVSQVEMGRMNENKEKMTFKDKLNLNLQLDGKRVGLKRTMAKTYKEIEDGKQKEVI